MLGKAVVIGSGVGGSGTAVLLAKDGHDVTLLEAHPLPEGRCTSTQEQRFHYDFGVHMVSRGDRGPLSQYLMV